MALIVIEADDLVPGAQQSPRDVAAHPAQTDHR
jgi:hypothetical protein